jgi:hypothetical protein
MLEQNLLFKLLTLKLAELKRNTDFILTPKLKQPQEEAAF